MTDESYKIGDKLALAESMDSLGFLADKSRYAFLLQCVRAGMDEKREKSATPPLFIQCDADLQFPRLLCCILNGLPARMREELRVPVRNGAEDASQDLILTAEDATRNGGAYLILRTGETNLDKRRLKKVERNDPYLVDAANLAPERISEFYAALDERVKALGDADASNDRIRKVAWELFWNQERQEFRDNPTLEKFADDERQLKSLIYDVVNGGVYSSVLKDLLEEIRKRVPDENLTESLRNLVKAWRAECAARLPPDAPTQSAKEDAPKITTSPKLAPDTPKRMPPPQPVSDTPQRIAPTDDGQEELETALTTLPDFWPPKDGWDFLVQLCRCFNITDSRTGKPVALNRENALIAELINHSFRKRGVLLSPEERDMLRMTAHVHDLNIFRTLYRFFRAFEARSVLDLLRICPALFAACADADAWRVAAYAERLLERFCTQSDPPWNPIPLDLWLCAGGALRGPENDCFQILELHPDAAILSDPPELVVAESVLLRRKDIRKRGASYVRTRQNNAVSSRVAAWLTLAERMESGGI